MIVLLVFVGGAVGAPTRYLLDRLVGRRHSGVFPWGTLTVNLLGSAILGALLGAAARGGVRHAVLALAGTGFCGALTTFSTFGYETMRLIEDGAVAKAALNSFGGLLLGLLVAAGAYASAAALL